MPETLPEKFEVGTMNILGIAGLNAALKWIKNQTVEKIFETEKNNRQKLINLLGDYNFIKIVGNFEKKNYVGIVSCVIDGISSDSAGNIFAERGISVRSGLQCAPLAHRFLKTFPAGTVRFSVNFFNTEKDFVELRKVLEEIKFAL